MLLRQKPHLAQEGWYEDPLTQRRLNPRPANFPRLLACPPNRLLGHLQRCWLRCRGRRRVADAQAQPRQELLHPIVAGSAPTVVRIAAWSSVASILERKEAKSSAEVGGAVTFAQH